MSSSGEEGEEEALCFGVHGFQFEPLRKDLEDSWETVEEYEDNVDEPSNRMNLSIDDWCQCKICTHMPTERECFCCHDLDTADNFLSKGQDKVHCTKVLT